MWSCMVRQSSRVNHWWRHQMETFSALLVICAGNSPGTLNFVICFDLVWINGWVNIREAGGLRRYRAHYDVTVMSHVSMNKRSIPSVTHPNIRHVAVQLVSADVGGKTKCLHYSINWGCAYSYSVLIQFYFVKRLTLPSYSSILKLKCY